MQSYCCFGWVRVVHSRHKIVFKFSHVCIDRSRLPAFQRIDDQSALRLKKNIPKQDATVGPPATRPARLWRTIGVALPGRKGSRWRFCALTSAGDKRGFHAQFRRDLCPDCGGHGFIVLIKESSPAGTYRGRCGSLGTAPSRCRWPRSRGSWSVRCSNGCTGFRQSAVSFCSPPFRRRHDFLGSTHGSPCRARHCRPSGAAPTFPAYWSSFFSD